MVIIVSVGLPIKLYSSAFASNTRLCRLFVWSHTWYICFWVFLVFYCKLSYLFPISYVSALKLHMLFSILMWIASLITFFLYWIILHLLSSCGIVFLDPVYASGDCSYLRRRGQMYWWLLRFRVGPTTLWTMILIWWINRSPPWWHAFCSYSCSSFEFYFILNENSLISTAHCCIKELLSYLISKHC